MYRPCPNCLSFLLQTFPSPADSTFRDRQLFFDSKLKVCFDEVDRTRLQLALQQFAKDTISWRYIAHCSVHQQKNYNGLVSRVIIIYYYLLQVIYKAKQPVTPDQQVKKVQVD